MNITVLGKDGSKKGSLSLNAALFGIEPNVAVMHQAVKMHLANRRQGTHKTKERAEVRGGGRKPWRQKGRGVARAGTSRSPLWVGGGTIFGPRPHGYRQNMPKKMRKLARRSALSLKAQANELIIIDDLRFESIKTSAFAAMLKAVEAGGKKALVLLSDSHENTLLSARNLSGCSVLNATAASTYDILNNQVLVIEKSALDLLEELLLDGKENEKESATETTADAAPAKAPRAPRKKKEPAVETEVIEDEADAGEAVGDIETGAENDRGDEPAGGNVDEIDTEKE